MKRFLVLLCCVLVPFSLMAQQRTGNIYGTVEDSQGAPLPGVNVTLTGATIAPIVTQTSAEGKFRFLSLFPGNDYAVKCELQGFKTRSETGIIVNVNKNAEITVKMEQGALEEQVTVVATTPVVDTKRTQVTHTVNYEMLQELPSARDPWVILQLTPAVQMDRENVGGVESGQQSYFQAKGGTTQEWTMDGMQITDKASVSSPIYFDFDTFEEMNISTGTMDVEHRDSGIAINIVTRRGGNKTSLGGRFFYTNHYFQAKRTDAFLAAHHLSGYNRADDIKDFGFNAGGPIYKDKAWWWVSYGIQQISTINQINVADKTNLTGYAAKINLQLIPSNRAEFFATLNDKIKQGRDSSENFPFGWAQSSKYKFGIPVIKFQDEQTLGDNLFLSLRLGKTYGGFGMTPENDLSLNEISYWDIAGARANFTYNYFYSDRPHAYYVAQAQYFNDNVMGTAHEIKVGFEINNNQTLYVGGYPGNIWNNFNYNYPVMDWAGTGSAEVPPANMMLLDVTRGVIQSHYGVKRIAAYFSDIITKGRFNINLSLRMDSQYDYNGDQIARSLWMANETPPTAKLANYPAIDARQFTADAIAAIRALMPDQTSPYIRQTKTYPYFSPRVGLTYDLLGDGKTILKASYSLYPGYGIGVGYNAPYGFGGWMNMWWWDLNNDRQASLNELFMPDVTQANWPLLAMFNPDGSLALTQSEVNAIYGNWNGGYSGFAPGTATLEPSTWRYDSKTWKTDLTHELNFAVEREIMKDFGASLSFTWKRQNRFAWGLSYYPVGSLAPDGTVLTEAHLRNKGDYEVKGTIPDSLVDGSGNPINPGQAAGREWWGGKPYLTGGVWNGNFTYPTSFNFLGNYPNNRANIYYGFDLNLTKRLANKWMATASFTYQMTTLKIGDGWLEPTTNWAYDNKLYSFSQGGGSGKISQNLFSRWMLKVTGMYQLPLDINVSGTISAHEGSIILNYLNVYNLTLNSTGGRSYGSIPTTTYDKMPRLSPVWVMNMKLEKGFRVASAGRMYFSVDAFNVFNTKTLTRRYNVSLGSFYFSGPTGTETQTGYANPVGTSGVYNEVLNPRLFRLGMRFEF